MSVCYVGNQSCVCVCVMGRTRAVDVCVCYVGNQCFHGEGVC